MRCCILLLLCSLCCSFFLQGVWCANVVVQWDDVAFVNPTSSTTQLVINPLARRGTLLHNRTFEALKRINRDHVRFQGWYPYPKLVVAELYPPSGLHQCATASQNNTIYLQCREGVISGIDFASYGTPQNSCGTFAKGKCDSVNSASVVESLCLNKASCSVQVTNSIFGGDPCPSITAKWLSVQARCSYASNTTSWDFSLLDPLMEDFMSATEGHTHVIDLCTPPSWMWNAPPISSLPQDPNQLVWNYTLGRELRDASMQEVSSYYVRVYEWYAKGGFVDEFGKYHHSGHYYNITYWEVLNEYDLDPITIELYTKIYDAVVLALRKVDLNLQFIGPASANRNMADISYFLNSSNHAPSVPPVDYVSYHFYAWPTNNITQRNNVSVYLGLFSQADWFLGQIQQIQKIRSTLSPSTDI